MLVELEDLKTDNIAALISQLEGNVAQVCFRRDTVREGPQGSVRKKNEHIAARTPSREELFAVAGKLRTVFEQIATIVQFIEADGGSFRDEELNLSTCVDIGVRKK